VYYRKCIEISKEKHAHGDCKSKVCKPSKAEAMMERRKSKRQPKKGTGLQNPQGGDDELDKYSHTFS
jgi:hypothetical protein